MTYEIMFSFLFLSLHGEMIQFDYCWNHHLVVKSKKDTPYIWELNFETEAWKHDY